MAYTTDFQNLTERLQSQLDPDFFQDDNDVQKKPKKRKQHQQNLATQKWKPELCWQMFLIEDTNQKM